MLSSSMAEPKLPKLRTAKRDPDDESTVAAAAAATPVAKSPWVLGLCSVLFDVDKGQTLQDLWPLDCLSEEDKAAVAFHAFPDSLSMELYTRNAIRDSSFSFRIKREPETLNEAGMPEFLYGYVFCRQRQDETLRRGGEQVSVLVLTTTPFSGALLPLSQAAGHAFFNEGPLALAMVYNQALAWPPPIPGGSMCVPIGAGVINARLPYFCIMPPPQPEVDPSVQASLPRRMSRTFSRKASGSPRFSTLAAARTGSAGSGSGDQTPVVCPAAEPAAAPAAAAVAAVTAQQHEQENSGAHAGKSAAAVETVGTATGSEDSGWALVSDPSQQQQQQQEQAPAQGMSSRGSFGNLLGLAGARSNSSSRLSRPDLAGTGSGSNGNLAAVVADSGSNGVGSSGSSDWLVTNLGQHWRDEKPFPEVEPALVLAPLLRDLWTLWQLVVTGQPLMVVGLNPGETSAAVAALASLIAPLPYAADFRPYFTIHDPDFVALAAGQLPQRQRYVEVLPQQQQPQGQAALQPDQQQQQGSHAATAEAGKGVEQQSAEAAAGQQQVQQMQGQHSQQDLQQQREQQVQQSVRQQHQQQQRKAPKQFHLPALIGVTNLYFIKALPKWPNVVAVSKKEILTPTPSASSRSGSPAKTSASNAGPAAVTAAAGAGSSAAAAAEGAGSPSAAAAAVGPSHARTGSGSGAGFFSSTAAAAMRALQRRHQGPQHLLSHFAPHLWTTKHTQCVKPDHALLSKARAAIEPAVGSAGGAMSAAGSSSGSSGSSALLGPNSAAVTAAARLRRHFAELTAGLLAPFEAYFTPGPNGKVPAWRPEAFLASLDPAALSPALTARLSSNTAASAAALYGAFIESPNFAFWFKQRRAPVLHLVEEEPESDEDEGFAKVAAAGGDSSDAGVQSDPDEVELVQQLLSVEQELLDWQQLGKAQKAVAVPNGWQQQEQVLQLHMVQTFLQLPPDLQTALFSSPVRQEQLQEAAAVLAAGKSAEQGAAAAVLQKMQELMISAGAGADTPTSQS